MCVCLSNVGIANDLVTIIIIIIKRTATASYIKYSYFQDIEFFAIVLVVIIVAYFSNLRRNSHVLRLLQRQSMLFAVNKCTFALFI